MRPCSQEEYGAALRELEALHPTTILEIDTAQFVLLIGALQLALRHPSFPSYSRKVITQMIEGFIEQIPNQTMKDHIRMGFDPRYDV